LNHFTVWPLTSFSLYASKNISNKGPILLQI